CIEFYIASHSYPLQHSYHSVISRPGALLVASAERNAGLLITSRQIRCGAREEDVKERSAKSYRPVIRSPLSPSPRGGITACRVGSANLRSVISKGILAHRLERMRLDSNGWPGTR